MNIRKRVLSGFLAIALLAGIFVNDRPMEVSAAKSSAAIKNELNDLEEEKAKIDKELKALQKQLADHKGEMQAMVNQKNVIDQEITLMYQQIDNINDQLTAYNNLIADKQDELDKTEARLAELQVQNAERIRAMEKNGKLSYWAVIFDANSFSDLLDRLKIVRQIQAADRNLMSEMNQAIADVAEAKAGLEAEKTSLEATKAELAESQKKLEEKRAEADKLLAQLAERGLEFEAMVSESLHDSATLKEQILEKEEQYDAAKDREYKEYLAQMQQQQKPNYSGGNAGTSNTVAGVDWLVPISYTAFTSAYGWRDHPVYGGQRFHHGVDLAAPSGTPIYATRSGVVTTASYEAGGAGNYVSINHKDGFSSIYMHMTRYVVYAGQYVYAGQVIGYCGSTGASTGPHLHFGIYYNGSSVNPANYIKI
ncbi:MAG: peptidoglycan DD-metalloendopeptidase family protein [Oscillospiraceae bacterium]|nr:peptidoglycan DD-metalloendopeptidase family protein [Oscillospiraceae bacterium]